MSATLLFEIGAEELPPSELPGVLQALAESAAKDLDDARLSRESLTVYSTPRRLAIFVRGLATQQPSRRTLVTGPPKKAAFDAAGKPTKAAEGFARSQGVALDQLQTITTDRGEYLAVDRLEEGRPAAAVLPELLVRLGSGLPFAKQMRWGDGDARFSRPVRWVVALLDDAVLPVSVAGVAAGRVTFGHRFLHPAAISLARAEEYAGALEAARVQVDVDRRRSAVRDAVERAAAELGHRAVVDAHTLESVLHLVEWPATVVGGFPKEFLDLPRQVVETPIRHHQRCFVMETADGRLVPHFVAVSNMPGVDPSEIRRGNERVIRARLADADFYFREDLKTTPEARTAALAGIVFHERVGTLQEKTDRIVALVEMLASQAPAADGAALRRAARLAKSDLASGMVREFPELEGVIGEEYALRAGEPRAVARAIREQYLPRSADGALPESLEGALLSVADKIDTIVGIIGAGMMPSGSQDPYALRRHAQGVVGIAMAFGDRGRISLDALVRTSLELLAAKLSEAPGTTRERVIDFFRARLATMLVARGRRADVVDAVLASGFDVPADVARRVEALTTLMQRPDWDPLVVTFKRTINILPAGFSGRIDPARFAHDVERRLHDATSACRAPVAAALAAGDYAAALSQLAGLRPIVDALFDAVMVMDKDPAVRDNRLALLKDLAEMLLPVADLRKIQASSAA
jgi:glycyl-tRNA synthetase beta chain